MGYIYSRINKAPLARGRQSFCYTSHEYKKANNSSYKYSLTTSNYGSEYIRLMLFK
ncbi:hypothetical protein D3C74_189200 [compost metagenome]